VINIVKTTKIPPSLALEKGKTSSKNYRCEGVVPQVILDFHNKCYICEDYGASTLNVEHFRPHKGNRDLMFAWENLFLACGHCNNLKLADFENMLDCTNPNHKILEWIKFDIKPFPKEFPVITAIANDSKTQETVELLRKVYNSENTDLKIGEAENIRERLINEVLAFGNLLQEYFEPTILEEEKPVALRKIRRMLSVKSPFTAFKVWVIKENQALLTEFSEFLPQ
jgi:HNH endonuclease